MKNDLSKSLAKPLKTEQFSSRYDSIEDIEADELMELPIDSEVL